MTYDYEPVCFAHGLGQPPLHIHISALKHFLQKLFSRWQLFVAWTFKFCLVWISQKKFPVTTKTIDYFYRSNSSFWTAINTYKELSSNRIIYNVYIASTVCAHLNDLYRHSCLSISSNHLYTVGSQHLTS